jgi:hypothetical protein
MLSLVRVVTRILGAAPEGIDIDEEVHRKLTHATGLLGYELHDTRPSPEEDEDDSEQ